jgi:hypothetical protein
LRTLTIEAHRQGWPLNGTSSGAAGSCPVQTDEGIGLPSRLSGSCQQGSRSLMADHSFTQSAVHMLVFLLFRFRQRMQEFELSDTTQILLFASLHLILAHYHWIWQVTLS